MEISERTYVLKENKVVQIFKEFININLLIPILNDIGYTGQLVVKYVLYSPQEQLTIQSFFINNGVQTAAFFLLDQTPLLVANG